MHMNALTMSTTSLVWKQYCPCNSTALTGHLAATVQVSGRQGQSAARTSSHQMATLRCVPQPLRSHQQNGENKSCPVDITLWWARPRGLTDHTCAFTTEHPAPCPGFNECLSMIVRDDVQEHLRNDKA